MCPHPTPTFSLIPGLILGVARPPGAGCMVRCQPPPRARPTSGPHHTPPCGPRQILAPRWCQRRGGTDTRTGDRALHVKSSLNSRPLLPCSLKNGTLTSVMRHALWPFRNPGVGRVDLLRQYTGLEDFHEAFTERSIPGCSAVVPTGVFSFFDSGRKYD